VSRDAERLLKRLDRLQRLQGSHKVACENRLKVFAEGRRLRYVDVRSDLVLGSPFGRPPLPALITPRGMAIQTYLVALFEAQCRHRPGNEPDNHRVLRATERDEIGWLGLLASVADASTATSVERATSLDNLLRQAKSALRALAASNLVQLSGETSSHGRYEQFKLGHESGGVAFLTYTVPQARLHQLIRLPIDFFLRGWVHVLSPAEIATYLMMRHLGVAYPDRHQNSGVFVAGAYREDTYGLSRDVYEAHRALTAFRLLERLPDSRRWPNGRIRNFKEVVAREDGAQLPAHRFRARGDDALKRDAWLIVTNRLRQSLRPTQA